MSGAGQSSRSYWGVTWTKPWLVSLSLDVASVKDVVAGRTVTAAIADRADVNVEKLSYKLQRELDGMEEAILEAEGAVETLMTKINDPAIMADRVAYAEACETLATAQAKVQTLYDRWAELEAMQDN